MAENEKKQLIIEVKDKIATLISQNFQLVGGNSDYEVVFEFDEDWKYQEVKTAVFVFGDNSKEQTFDGNVCRGVAINNASQCYIGVYVGDIKTTTSACVDCLTSISDLAQSSPKAPEENVYNQIIELINKYIAEGAKPDPVDIQRMVEEYLASHPAKDGFSPTVSITAIENGNRLTITDINGAQYFDINNGAKGDKGDRGEAGVSVSHAWQGTTLVITSASGTSSVDLKGEKGEQGEKGAKGDTGAKGDRGEKGERGPQGIQGAQGIQGERGLQGEKGDIGARIVKTELYGTDYEGNNIYIQTFADGTTARFVAPKGDKGDTGAQGDRGLQGEQGEQGEKGEDGFSPVVKSTPITDGHRISITTETGTTVFDLYNGEKGEQGERGQRGEQGIQGVQGERGEKGDPYVLTAEDKSNIVKDVLNALPNGDEVQY